jgi:hypothetical protein
MFFDQPIIKRDWAEENRDNLPQRMEQLTLHLLSTCNSRKMVYAMLKRAVELREGMATIMVAS